MFKMELTGNVCKAPETKATALGKDVTYFDVAVYIKPEKSEFVQVNAWGKLGEICQKNLDKGRKVYVRGTFGYSTYSTQAGQTRVQLTITADEVEFLSPKEEKKDTATVAKVKVVPDDSWIPDTNKLPF